MYPGAIQCTPVFFLFDFPCVSAVFPRGNASSLISIYCVNAVPKALTQTTLPLSPPQSNMAPPSEDNGKVKKHITKLPWRCAHHIRVIHTVNDVLLCLGYGCSSASPPPLIIFIFLHLFINIITIYHLHHHRHHH